MPLPRTVDDRGRIIADYGLFWLRGYRNDGEYYACGTSYRIRRATDVTFSFDRLRLGMWGLFRESGRRGVADQTIFHGSLADCMRVAEIYDARRRE